MAVTSEGRRKTKSSEADVPLDEALISRLRCWQAAAKGIYVVEAAGEAAVKSYGKKYRCDAVFAEAIA